MNKLEFNKINQEDVKMILNLFSDVETIRKTKDGYFILIRNNGGDAAFDIKIEDNAITNIILKNANAL